MRIRHVQAMVEEILIKDPETRDDDNILYVKVLSKMHPEVLGMTMQTVLTHERQLGIPSIESVGRARRKIQEYNPLLRASKRVDDARYEKFKEYREYGLQEV